MPMKNKRGAFSDLLLQQIPELTTLLVTINTKWNDSITGLQPQVVYGKGYVIERLGDFRFKIGPQSFFQTNTRQGERSLPGHPRLCGIDGERDGL